MYANIVKSVCLYMFSIMQQVKLPILLPVGMGDLLHNVNVFCLFVCLFVCLFFIFFYLHLTFHLEIFPEI